MCLLLCLWIWGNSLGEFQFLPVDDCSAVTCDSSCLARGSERASFYSAILNQSLLFWLILINNSSDKVKGPQDQGGEAQSILPPCLTGTKSWFHITAQPRVLAQTSARLLLWFSCEHLLPAKQPSLVTQSHSIHLHDNLVSWEGPAGLRTAISVIDGARGCAGRKREGEGGRTREQTSVRMHAHTLTCAYTLTHIHAHTSHTCTCTHTCTHRHEHTSRACTHTHTHTHTHTYKHTWDSRPCQIIPGTVNSFPSRISFMTCIHPTLE